MRAEARSLSRFLCAVMLASLPCSLGHGDERTPQCRAGTMAFYILLMIFTVSQAGDTRRARARVGRNTMDHCSF